MVSVAGADNARGFYAAKVWPAPLMSLSLQRTDFPRAAAKIGLRLLIHDCGNGQLIVK